MKNLLNCKYIYIVVMLLLSFQSKSFAKGNNNAVNISTSVDKTIATIAERITYTVLLEYNKDITCEIILPEKQIGIFKIHKTDVSDKDTKDKIIKKFTFQISSLETGKHLLPRETIKYYSSGNSADITTIKTPSIQIDIKSLLEHDEKITDLSKLKDIKKPVLIALDKTKLNKIILVALAFVILIIMIIVLIKIYRNRKNQPKIPLKTPYEIAIEELIRLQHQHLVEHNQVKEYYFKLSIIIRKYLEGRFAINAPTQTTEEFFKIVSKNDVLKTEYKLSLQAFLNNCDFVKFAKYMPEKEEIEKTYNSAKDFIESTHKEDIAMEDGNNGN